MWKDNRKLLSWRREKHPAWKSPERKIIKLLWKGSLDFFVPQHPRPGKWDIFVFCVHLSEYCTNSYVSHKYTWNIIFRIFQRYMYIRNSIFPYTLDYWLTTAFPRNWILFLTQHKKENFYLYWSNFIRSSNQTRCIL